MDYNSTLNLPKTDFPMRAGLPQREPEMLKKWNEGEVYQKLQEKNKDKPKFVLHDGLCGSDDLFYGIVHFHHAADSADS